MNIKYDKKMNAMYIELAKGTYEKTRKVSDVVMVDEDKKGRVLGIEILDATQTIPKFKTEETNFRIITS